MTTNEFLKKVERFIAEKGLTPTAFGRLYAGDPNFIFDIRSGRVPRKKKIAAVMAAIGFGAISNG